MSAITDALTQIRDEAYLNSTALGMVRAEAQTRYDAVRGWPNSAMKRDLMQKLGVVLSSYANAQREAEELRIEAHDALLSMTADVPPLPDPGDGSFPPWSTSEW